MFLRNNVLNMLTSAKSSLEKMYKEFDIIKIEPNDTRSLSEIVNASSKNKIKELEIYTRHEALKLEILIYNNYSEDNLQKVLEIYEEMTKRPSVENKVVLLKLTEIEKYITLPPTLLMVKGGCFYSLTKYAKARELVLQAYKIHINHEKDERLFARIHYMLALCDGKLQNSKFRCLDYLSIAMTADRDGTALSEEHKRDVLNLFVESKKSVYREYGELKFQTFEKHIELATKSKDIDFACDNWTHASILEPKLSYISVNIANAFLDKMKSTKTDAILFSAYFHFALAHWLVVSGLDKTPQAPAPKNLFVKLIEIGPKIIHLYNKADLYDIKPQKESKAESVEDVSSEVNESDLKVEVETLDTLFAYSTIEAEMLSKDPASRKETTEKLLEIVRSSKNKAQIASIYLLLGKTHQINKDYNASLYYYTFFLEFAEREEEHSKEIRPNPEVTEDIANLFLEIIDKSLASANPTLKYNKELAFQLMKQKKYARAADQYRLALKANKLHSSFHFMLARSLRQSNPELTPRIIDQIRAHLSFAIWLQEWDLHIDKEQTSGLLTYYNERKTLFLSLDLERSYTDHLKSLRFIKKNDVQRETIKYKKMIEKFAPTYSSLATQLQAYKIIALLEPSAQATENIAAAEKRILESDPNYITMQKEEAELKAQLELAEKEKQAHEKEAALLAEQARIQKLASDKAAAEKRELEARQERKANAIKEKQQQREKAAQLKREQKLQQQKVTEQKIESEEIREPALNNKQRRAVKRAERTELAYKLFSESVEKLHNETKKQRAVRLPSIAITPEAKEIFEKLGVESQSYIVGGYVRDSILGKLSAKADIDFVTNLNPSLIRKRFEKNIVFASDKLTKLEFYRIEIKIENKVEIKIEHKIEVDIWHSEHLLNSSLEKDAENRDFYINALYVNRNGKVIDPTDKAYDKLKQKPLVIETIVNADISFDGVENSLKILRAIYYSHKLKVPLSDEIDKAITKHQSKLDKLPADILRAQLNKCFFHTSSAEIFKEFHTRGILKHIFKDEFSFISFVFENLLRSTLSIKDKNNKSLSMYKVIKEIKANAQAFNFTNDFTVFNDQLNDLIENHSLLQKLISKEKKSLETSNNSKTQLIKQFNSPVFTNLKITTRPTSVESKVVTSNASVQRHNK